MDVLEMSAQMVGKELLEVFFLLCDLHILTEDFFFAQCSNWKCAEKEGIVPVIGMSSVCHIQENQ